MLYVWHQCVGYPCLLIISALIFWSWAGSLVILYYEECALNIELFVVQYEVQNKKVKFCFTCLPEFVAILWKIYILLIHFVLLCLSCCILFSCNRKLIHHIFMIKKTKYLCTCGYYKVIILCDRFVCQFVSPIILTCMYAGAMWTMFCVISEPTGNDDLSVR